MGKIADYANVLKSKLTDLFVVYQRNNGELETKNATLEQLGDAICGEQVHSDLKTDNQTIIGGINELAKDKNIADEYDDTHTYNTGDVTIYDNTLYICNTNNTTGTFDPSKWTATTIDNVIGSLSQLTTSDKSSIVGAVNEVNASKMTMLRLKSISITGATGVAWTPHYYKDIDISSYFTGDDANAVIIGVIINQQTSGGVLCAMLQGARTIRLLNDQAFTNVTCNITCLYYRT